MAAETKTGSRGAWGSKIGLILAMSGNAVGLGNFWRFPRIAAQNGGGAFMIPYFIALLVLGLPLMITEWNLGRYGGKFGHGTLGPMVYVQAREKIGPKNALCIGAICGGLAFSVTLLVNAYYNHIIGWTLHYSLLSLFGKYRGQDTAQLYADTISNPVTSILFWVLVLAFLAFAVSRGIQRGIEAWAKIMMPALYVFGIMLAVIAFTLPANAAHPDWTPLRGLNFLWNPDFSKLNWTAALAAAGQIFFTLSLGMGIITNYASYLKPKDDIVVASVATISLNEFAEIILASTAVIPISYTFMGEHLVDGGSIGFTFISLPKAFQSIAGGQWLGAIWFLLLFFAGFTSAIAMYNYLTTLVEEDLGLRRTRASMIVFCAYLVVGLPVLLEPVLTGGHQLFFSELDNWVGTYLLLFLGLAELLVAGWCVRREQAVKEINQGALAKIPRWFFTGFIKIVSPLALIVVIIFSTVDYARAGYFSLQQDPWVHAARIVILLIFLAGTAISWRSVNRAYKTEIHADKKKKITSNGGAE